MSLPHSFGLKVSAFPSTARRILHEARNRGFVRKDQVHACKQSQLTKARTLVLDDSRTMPVGLGRFVDTKMSIARRLRPCKRASRSGSWICGIDGPEACREESAGIER
ncbi:hypothetical protein HZH66_000521 [Vespula vulgaris]|uniref:Uncharacterized protein n=2 Tax=Vespula TaxID=7451 RepID=A0A834KSG2_VESVU|nr:hypothetical protein HZH66_000521 [Vespula vulgaris]